MKSELIVVWIWQRIVSPHMADLAVQLALRGCEVTYVAECEMSADRAMQGWSAPALPGVKLQFATSASTVKRLVQFAPVKSVHICQGLRANGLIGVAQRALGGRGLRQWAVMETVEDTGWRGILKQLEYRRLFMMRRSGLEGVLATGYRTSNWVVARGMHADRVFPFAYFLPAIPIPIDSRQSKSRRFRFIYVGRIIELKRLDLLIDALAKLSNIDFELVVVGTGPLASELKTESEKKLSGRVIWKGLLPSDKVASEVSQADCLVLPSRYDGWGAVVSESLMVGTPVICSDGCGSAEVVRESKFGGVFESGVIDSLIFQLMKMLNRGRMRDDEVLELVKWANCLSAYAGADYLSRIIEYMQSGGLRPMVPWDCRNREII